MQQGRHRGPSGEHSVPDAEPSTSRQGDEPAARVSVDVNAAAACVGSTRAFSAAASAGCADLHVIIAPPTELPKADEEISGKINPASLVTAAAAGVTPAVLPPTVPPSTATEVAPTNGGRDAPLAPVMPLTPGVFPLARGPAAAYANHPDGVLLATLSPAAGEGEAGACCWPRRSRRPSSLRRSISLPTLSPAAAILGGVVSVATADGVSSSSNSRVAISAVLSGSSSRWAQRQILPDGGSSLSAAARYPSSLRPQLPAQTPTDCAGQQRLAESPAIMHATFGWRVPARRSSLGTPAAQMTDLQRLSEVFRLGKEARALCAASRSRRSSCGVVVSASGL